MSPNYDPNSSAHILYYTSYFFLVASMVSYAYHDVLSSMFFLALFMTSINHWRNPCFGFNRIIDITCCCLILVYMYLLFLLNYGSFHMIVFEIILTIIVFVLLMEWIFYVMGHPFWIVFHLIIHTYAAYFLILGLYFL